jgi:hypothetical protein
VTETAKDVWPEEEYLHYLKAERALYAWCLLRVGGIPADEATARADTRFPYEPPDKPYRGLIHHAGAWEIAMVDLFRDHTRRPEEFGLADELKAQALWLFHGERK